MSVSKLQLALGWAHEELTAPPPDEHDLTSEADHFPFGFHPDDEGLVTE